MKPLSGSLQVKLPFESQRLRLAITDIVPLRIVDASVKASRKYIQIAASVREVGIVELRSTRRGADNAQPTGTDLVTYSNRNCAVGAAPG